MQLKNLNHQEILKMAFDQNDGNRGALFHG